MWICIAICNRDVISDWYMPTYVILEHFLCRIDGYSLDANTKVYADGSAILRYFFFLRLERACAYMGVAMNK